MHMWRKLTPKQEGEFRTWARQNYVPGTEIDPLWHPVVRAECDRINADAGDIGALCDTLEALQLDTWADDGGPVRDE